LDASHRQAWIRVALLLGVVYFVIGRVFAVPTSHVKVWRLAAWVVSLAVFAAHIGYEHFKLRHSPRFTALHTALAVAFGAFLLAVAGAIHSLGATSAIRPLWLVAFVVWPVATGVPAFLVAFVVAMALASLRP
jgi:hypothetical protein